MLDISRTRVPTVAHLRAVVDLLASCRANHLQLYTEHAFAYRGHKDVWRGADPVTPAELADLSAYAAARGVAVAGNQNCLGHMTRWLERPRYAPLAETHGRWDFLGMERTGPFSLCPADPGSLALAADLIGQQMACLSPAGGGEAGRGSPPLFNIGCDEAFDIGRGRSAAAVAERGMASVYGEYVAGLCGAVAGHGGRPMFWADIALRHPGALGRIPAGAVALVWGYEPDADFAGWCRACREGGRSVWVCPGTSSWRSLTGRTSERRANLAAAVRGGLEAGAEGLMICDWGDCGHLQQWPVAGHAIVEAMEAAWTGTVGGGPAGGGGAAGAWLDELGDADLSLRRAMRAPPAGAPPLVNAGALFTALWPARPGYAFPADPRLWGQARARLDALAADVPGDGLAADELAHTVRLAGLAAEVGAWLHAGGPEPRAWRARLGAIGADHRRLWTARSRPGGLDESGRVFGLLRGRLGAGSLGPEARP
jgi:hypothetical protein